MTSGSRIRSINVTVPAGNIVAFQLDQSETGEDWTVAQAGLTAGEKTLTITARFKPRSRFYRLTWVPDGGTRAGLLLTDPVPLNSDDVTHKGSSLA